jgi:hypothetical protein
MQQVHMKMHDIEFAAATKHVLQHHHPARQRIASRVAEALGNLAARDKVK